MNTMNTAVDIIDDDRNNTEDSFQLLAVFWSKKWWIILTGIVFGLFGLAAAHTIPPKFKAEALVQLETRNNGVQFSSDIADMLSPESEAVTEIEILKSRLVLGKVVSNLQLDVVATPIQLPIIGNLLQRVSIPRPNWAFLAPYAWHDEKIRVSSLVVPLEWIDSNLTITKLSDETFSILSPDNQIRQGVVGKSLEDKTAGLNVFVSQLEGRDGAKFSVKRLSVINAVETIRSGLSVSEKNKSSGILRVSMVSTSGDQSKIIVSEIVDSYVNQNIGRSAEEAERSLAFLNEQLPLIQSQLRTAESALNEYRLESESIDLNYEAQSMLEQSVTLDSQISGLSLEETELSRRYTRNHPSYKALLEKKARLQDEKLSLAASVKNLPATQQEILRKTRDVNVSQQIYLQLLNKSQELSVMKAGAVGNVRLIDAAEANPNSVEPRIPMIAALSVIFGGAMAVGLIFLRHNLSKEIDSPEDLARLPIPVFAVVPFSRYQSKMEGSQRKKARFGLLAREHGSELAIEAIRSLRTNLHFSLQDRERNIVCVTGPSPTVGKSFISSNLAFLAAQSGAKVLLIDADMRRGTIGRYFNVPQKLPGLAQMLEGSTAGESVKYKIDLETLHMVKREKQTKQALSTSTAKSKLVAEIDCEYDLSDDSDLNEISRKNAKKARHSITLVPRGPAPLNPSELLMHNRLPEFLERASQDYDLVVVDTPPVLAATDAAIVGKYSDMNLLVVRQGETTTHEAEEVVRTFSNNKTRFSGIVLNGYNAQGGKYGKYGTQYGYRYAY